MITDSSPKNKASPNEIGNDVDMPDHNNFPDDDSFDDQQNPENDSRTKHMTQNFQSMAMASSGKSRDLKLANK